jgi:hypothetical protein
MVCSVISNCYAGPGVASINCPAYAAAVGAASARGLHPRGGGFRHRFIPGEGAGERGRSV